MEPAYALLGTNQICTTAYHPIANGLVERLHRQLKGVLKCMPDCTHWTKALPLILLGLRTTVKQDLKCTTAELVYGTTLRLPGEFLHTHMHTTHTPDPVNYTNQLKTVMQKLQPPSVRRHQQRTTHIHKDLHTCSFVFVRNDAVKKPLKLPYNGLFKVLQRTNKRFTLDINGTKKTVSLDQLKTAYMDDTVPSTNNTTSTTDTISIADTTKDQRPSPAASCTSPAKTTPTVTRSGRRVHWPRRGVLWQHHLTTQACSVTAEIM